MKFEMVLGILGHKVVLDDLRLESLCLKYPLLPLLGTHNYEQYDLSGYSYNIEVLSGQVQSYNILLDHLDPL